MISLLLATLLCLDADAQDRGARGDDVAFSEDEDDSYTPPPKDRLYFSNATFARVNPLGLINNYKVGWRHRLSTKDSVLFQDTYTFVGASSLVTPAYARLGLYGEAQVLAILRFFVDVSGTGYFSTFDQLLTWDDPSTAMYSDQSIAARGDEAFPELGWVFTTGATLRAAAGPIAIRSTFTLTRYDMAFEEDGLYFYDQFWDRLAPDGGFMGLNDADLLYVNRKLRLGVRHTWSDTFDGRDDGSDSALAHHRVGPLFAWQFKNKDPGARFNQPTMFVLAQWWAQHPYRKGQEQPQGLPLIAIGFAFNGDYRIMAN
jgi:hypothetical protein